MHWSKIDKLWNDRLAKTGEGDVSWKTEQWPVPGEDPLEVRMCTRKGVPLSKYALTHEAPRTSIMLHLTAGYGNFQGLMGSADHDSASVHFLLGRCGTPYCLVPTEFTSWHGGYWNDNSIGIEIDNIANLFKKGDNLVSCYSAGKDVYCGMSDKDVFLEKKFAGCQYWSTLTEKQYLGLGKLLKALCFKHQIPRILLPEPQRYQPFERKDRATFRGICTHLNVDPKHRADIGPYIDWDKLIQYAGLITADCLHPPDSVLDTWKNSTGGKIETEPKEGEEKPTSTTSTSDNHTLRLHVGKRGGRICFSVKRPGDPMPTAPDPGEAPAPKAPGKRDEFIQACMNFLGAPYKAGSNKPDEGLDGANLIGIAMRRVGLFKSDEETPTDAEHLSALWHSVSGDPKEPPEEILPGDLVWFGRGDHDNDPMQHPMVYLGGGRALGPIPDGGPHDGAVQVIAVAKVPEKFAGWMHVDDFGTETKHTGHPGDPPHAGEKITAALLPATPAGCYDKLKELVAKAGGKWEEGKGKINLIGVKNLHDRCMITPKTDDWNDTLFAAFLDEGGHKCVLDLRASLNPGTDTARAKTWHLWEGSYAFKLLDGGTIKTTKGEPPPTSAATEMLVQPHFAKQHHKAGEEAELVVDAAGLDGRTVQFIVERKRFHAAKWETVKELTAKVSGGEARAAVVVDHAQDVTAHEGTLLRFRAKLVPDEAGDKPATMAQTEVKFGKVLRAASKAKGWFDVAGLGAPRALHDGTEGAGEKEGGFDAVPVQLAAAGTEDRPSRPTSGTQIVWGGDDLSAPWGHLAGLIEKAGGTVQYTYLHGADLNAAQPAAPSADITGGDAPDVPPAPPPWKAPGVAPRSTGEALFADPGSAVFWPVRGTKNRIGRAVCYAGVDGKGYGLPKGGSGGRHFLADRPAGDPKANRFHVAVDLYADFHDLIVACESGKVIQAKLFYLGVWKVMVKCDSGLVINYGEVDAASVKKYGIEVGKPVQAGQPLAEAGKMLHDSMLHLEIYPPDTKDSSFYLKKEGPGYLGHYLNPTQYLLALAVNGR